MKKVFKKLFFACLLLTAATAAQAQPASSYSITESSGSFTATRGGATISTNTNVQTVIDAIRADAAGNDCEITFGSGGSTLNIGANQITFQNAGVGNI